MFTAFRPQTTISGKNATQEVRSRSSLPVAAMHIIQHLVHHNMPCDPSTCSTSGYAVQHLLDDVVDKCVSKKKNESKHFPQGILTLLLNLV